MINVEKGIKEIREAMGLTQKDFADLIGERQDTVSRWENTDPDELPLKVWKKIEKLSGKALKEPKALSVADRWQPAKFMRETLYKYLEDNGVFLNYDESAKEVYKNLVKKCIRKPRIALVGLSDVGKSTMINSLLGSYKMPAGWTPLTAITVYIKHRDDRPDFIKDTAWVFKSDGKTDLGFDLSYLDDELKCEELCVGKGDTNILSEYGIRNGNKNNDDIVAAVIYVYSPILKNVDLVDLPGYGTNDREADDIATRGIGQFADVLIFLSRSNGFLTGQETTALRIAIQGLPCLESKDNGISPLGNLFVVASQAHIVGNDLDLQRILYDGRIRFEKTLSMTAKEFFSERSKESGYEDTEKYLQNRFFSYTTDNSELGVKFESDLSELIEKLPQCVIDKTSTILRTYSKEYDKKLDSEIKAFDEMRKNVDTLKEELAILFDNEPTRKEKNNVVREKVISKIQRYKNDSIKEFEDAYNMVIDVDSIVELIKERGFKKNKGDIELLLNSLSSKLEGEVDKTLSKYSNELKGDIDEYLVEFQSFATANGKIEVNASIPFNAKRVFASGMAGLATFGGLTLWASTFGNLAGYIIVAKGVSLLSALGISMGGMAVVMPFVASIGGPVTLFIVTAILAAVTFAGIFSGGWQKSIGKKLVKEYDETNALEKYKVFIRKFWLDDTIKAFELAASEMEKEWIKSLENRKALIDNYDINDIERRIEEAKKMKCFLSDIPLPESGCES